MSGSAKIQCEVRKMRSLGVRTSLAIILLAGGGHVGVDTEQWTAAEAEVVHLLQFAVRPGDRVRVRTLRRRQPHQFQCDCACGLRTQQPFCKQSWVILQSWCTHCQPRHIISISY